jgi:hypothetical protein
MFGAVFQPEDSAGQAMFVNGLVNGGIDFLQFGGVQRLLARCGRGGKKSEGETKSAAQQYFIHITRVMLQTAVGGRKAK